MDHSSTIPTKTNAFTCCLQYLRRSHSVEERSLHQCFSVGKIKVNIKALNRRMAHSSTTPSFAVNKRMHASLMSSSSELSPAAAAKRPSVRCPLSADNKTRLACSPTGLPRSHHLRNHQESFAAPVNMVTFRSCISLSVFFLMLCIVACGTAASQNAVSKHTNATQRGKNTLVIRIGVILPFDNSHEVGSQWSKQKVSPAIEYAIERVRKQNLIVGPMAEDGTTTMDVVLEPTYEDSKCSDLWGPLAAIDMVIKERPHLFLGPVYHYALAPIARFSPHWNIPVMTVGAQMQAFGNKIEYRLLTRMLGSFDKIGEFFVMLYRHYGWEMTAIAYRDNQPTGKTHTAGRTIDYFIANAIHTQLVKYFARNGRNRDVFGTSFDETSPAYDLTNLLKELSLKARIVVLCASPDTVREIMLTAKELNFTNGEYVFFNIDLFSSKTQIERPWHRDNDTRNDAARKAYESLMTITLRKPESDEYKQFSKEVKERAKKQYGEAIYGDEEVNSFVGAFHDAVILYAHALNETLEMRGDPANGSDVTRRMWNRTFEGITGTVSIDENGDRNADYSLLDLDPVTERFEVVANYYGNRKEYEPVKDRKIHWPAGKTGPPPDTPICGFDNSGCPPKDPFPLYAIVIIVLGAMLVIVLLVAFLVYKHCREEAKLAEVNWRVKWGDILFGAPDRRSDLNRCNSHANPAEMRELKLSNEDCCMLSASRQ